MNRFKEMERGERRWKGGRGIIQIAHTNSPPWIEFWWG
jgi:hypothetical protein